MPTRTATALAVTLTVTLTVALAGSAHAADLVPGQVLVKLAHTAKTDDEARAALASFGDAGALELRLVKRSLFGWVVAAVAGDEREAAASLTREKGVLAAEPVAMMHGLRTPSDDRFGEMWGMQFINMESAWDTTVGVSSQRIGIVDSGINRSHVDLSSRDVGGFDFISEPELSADGDGRDADYNDDDFAGVFHGSHVAGTMAASADDGFGVPGINWQAGLMTARALGTEERGSVVDIAEGASWLAGFHVNGVPDIGADHVSVINMSLGGSGPCGSFESDVYSRIIAAGVAVVVAAGNDGNDVPSGAPANCPGVIDVGAFGPTGELASYSNFDARVDVVAPGGDQSAFGTGAGNGILSVDGSTDAGYIELQGTSMAAPHVTGVVSLMQAVNPRLSPRQIRDIFINGSFTCGNCQNHTSLDAVDALNLAASTTGELSGAIGGGSADATVGDGCPANSHADGDSCVCDAGFVVNAAGDGCVSGGGSTGGGSTGGGSTGGGNTGGGDASGCPAHSHESADAGFCDCDAGFVVNSDASACVADAGAKSCDAARGNWDCDNGSACVEGVCVQGQAGAGALGDSCGADGECNSGLCDGGVCTRPCDGACEDGFTCERDAIPGGLCRVDDGASGCSSTKGAGAGAAPFVAAVVLAFGNRRRR